MAPVSISGRRIGVFDSGFGGLTVLRALLPRISGAHYVYLGDTARLPYGTKSQATIARYAVESARVLESRGCEFLVIACNTATALALEDIRQAVRVPVLGVIEPGARAVRRALTTQRQMDTSSALSGSMWSRIEALPETLARMPLRPANQTPASQTSANQGDGIHAAAARADGIHAVAVGTAGIQALTAAPPDVLVLATPATVQSHAYKRACEALDLQTAEFACPLLVPLIEEAWIDHSVTRDVLRIYLSEALQLGSPSAVLLGCTHYPLVAVATESILRSLGSQAVVIDSAESTAMAVSAALSPAITTSEPPRPATFECSVTDSVEKFKRLGSIFLGRPIPEVHHLDLGG